LKRERGRKRKNGVEKTTTTINKGALHKEYLSMFFSFSFFSLSLLLLCFFPDFY